MLNLRLSDGDKKKDKKQSSYCGDYLTVVGWKDMNGLICLKKKKVKWVSNYRIDFTFSFLFHFLCVALILIFCRPTNPMLPYGSSASSDKVLVNRIP